MKRLLIAPLLFHASLPILSQSLDSVETTKTIAPAVVLVTGRTGEGTIVASGFLISSDGKIATNLHVIRDLRTGDVRLTSGEEFHTFSVLAFDEQKDLAIIKVPGFALPSVTLGNSDDAQVGEPVLIVGNPLGLQGSVTTGVISGIRNDPFGGGFKTLQTDAAVNPGNSGGPVVNNKKEVIGIVVFKVVGGENLNFAIPVNYLRGLLDSHASAISLEELRIKLGNRTEGTGAPQPPPPYPLPRKPQIPSWWLSADPKTVLSDPLFPAFSIEQREEILTQIDPKFAKMSRDNRHAYLWRSETDHLPKATTPSEVIRWNATDRNCSTEFARFNVLRKTITTNSFRVEATLDQVVFFKAHLKIVNKTETAISIVPQTFVLNVAKPKRYTLFFEYPSRVSFEIFDRMAAHRPPLGVEAVKAAADLAQRIEPESMPPGSLLPGMSVEGNVWFEENRYAREVVLRVSIADRAFDIPFTRLQ
jgi:hypothetical protein